MSNIHPLFRTALAPFAPAPAVRVSPALRPFAVTLTIGGTKHELSVVAFTSCDAISRAFDAFFDDGDETMPEGGMKVEVAPVHLLPRVA